MLMHTERVYFISRIIAKVCLSRGAIYYCKIRDSFLSTVYASALVQRVKLTALFCCPGETCMCLYGSKF